MLATKLKADPALIEAGTTLAGIVLLPEGRLSVFHAGDSRVLLCAGGYVRQLTADHTPVGLRVFNGELSEEDARDHPEARRLTRALGLIGDSEAELQCGLEWAPGDAFIICSDGLNSLDGGLSRQRLQEVMRQQLPLEERARQMVDEAAQADQADNATLVLVEVSALAAPDAGHGDG
jgi:protein phosphatase